MPEWQLERTRLLKDGSGVGDKFYLERASSREVLFDAKLWAATADHRRKARLERLADKPAAFPSQDVSTTGEGR